MNIWLSDLHPWVSFEMKKSPCFPGIGEFQPFFVYYQKWWQ